MIDVKKIVIASEKYIKIVSSMWLMSCLILTISTSLTYFLIRQIKEKKSFNKQKKITVVYLIDENLQSLYSKLFLQLVENIAQENWNKAINLSSKIKPLEANKISSIARLEDTFQQWNKALQYLENIPEESSLISQKIQKEKEYNKNIAWINYKIENHYSKWLEMIVKKSHVSNQNIKVTICDFSRTCRRFQGDQIIKSPASLIKVPLAISILKKVNVEKIDFSTKIKVNRGNFTEDASDIIVGKYYALKHLLFRMINQSSNIATNQLIDYLGWQKINQTLQNMGYHKTYIGFKVIGKRIYPSNPGCCSNRLTTDELTQMMLDIYTIKNPENQTLIKFLARQEDKTMGYNALQGDNLTWLGEKTGRHSQFKGTTVATKIVDKDYIITVAITQGTSEQTVSDLIKEIAYQIKNFGDLENINSLDRGRSSECKIYHDVKLCK